MSLLRSIVASLCLAVHPGLQAAQAVLIDYDEASARQHGEFPSRTQLARITERLHEAGVRSLLLKFFLDGPGDVQGNEALGRALGKGRSLLQASISSDPPTTRTLDARFHAGDRAAGIRPAIQGNEGWLPLPAFARAAQAVCFADVQRTDRVPLFELFNGKPVPTLYHCLLAETAGLPAVFKPGMAQFGARQWPINPAGEISLVWNSSIPLPRIPAADVLGGAGDWRARVKGKLAIVIYTGPKSPRRDLNGQSMKVHDAFARQAAALLAPDPPARH